MKKMILFAVAALMFASCGCNETKTSEEVVVEEATEVVADSVAVDSTAVEVVVE